MQLYLFFVFLFTASEVVLLLLKKSKKNAVKKQNDGGSLLFLWIVITGCITAGSIISMMHFWPGDPVTFRSIGISFISLGFIIRWIAIVQLGSMFTVDVAIANLHVLKMDAIYKMVRHPSYLGLVLIIAGLAFLMDSVLSCLVIIIPVFLAINYRIAIEEKALEEEFGDEYQNYKSRVKKIIPLVY
jgi:protein-S-isoprenylcysteine O-methyltransferase Ste14